jgi:hypothetical protein
MLNKIKKPGLGLLVFAPALLFAQNAERQPEPRDTQVIPQKSEAPSRTSETVPQDNQVVPQRAEDPSGTTDYVPQDSPFIPLWRMAPSGATEGRALDEGQVQLPPEGHVENLPEGHVGAINPAGQIPAEDDLTEPDLFRFESRLFNPIPSDE